MKLRTYSVLSSVVFSLMLVAAFTPAAGNELAAVNGAIGHTLRDLQVQGFNLTDIPTALVVRKGDIRASPAKVDNPSSQAVTQTVKTLDARRLKKLIDSARNQNPALPKDKQIGHDTPIHIGLANRLGFQCNDGDPCLLAHEITGGEPSLRYSFSVIEGKNDILLSKSTIVTGIQNSKEPRIEIASIYRLTPKMDFIAVAVRRVQKFPHGTPITADSDAKQLTPDQEKELAQLETDWADTADDLPPQDTVTAVTPK